MDQREADLGLRSALPGRRCAAADETHGPPTAWRARPLVIAAALLLAWTVGCDSPAPPVDGRPARDTASDRSATDGDASVPARTAESVPAEPPVAAKTLGETAKLEAVVPAPAEEAEAPAAPLTAARWLLHSPRSILLVEVSSTWGDHSQETRSRQGLQDLIKAADANEDNRTTWDELSAINDLLPHPSGTESLPPELLRTYDFDGDGQVDPAELRRLLARAYLVVDGWLAIQVDQRYERQLDSPTFRWLDQDHDGRMDITEVEQVAERLEAKDADDDGLVWATDLSGFDVSLNNESSERSMSSSSASQFVCGIHKDTDWDRLAFELEQLFSFGAPLTGADLPEDSQIARIDQQYGNDDGQLTTDELAYLKEISADLSVRLDWTTPALGLSGTPSSEHQTSFRAVQHGMAIELIVNHPPASRPSFANIDADADGQIEPQELAASAASPGIAFDDLDADNNGGVDTNEYELAMLIDTAIDHAFANARVYRNEDPLFAIMDQNQDRRLDSREIDTASALLRPLLETSGDGIRPADLAGSISIAFSTGLVPSSSPSAAAANTGVASSPPPRWFTEMDIDSSGDVAADEFPGPAETFVQLDVDGDGYVEREEVIRWDPE